MRYIFYVFWIVVIILGVSFASLNSHPVTINYYTNETTVQIPILLLLTLVIGALLGMMAMFPVMLKNKNTTRRLKQRIKQIEQEVNNLRAIPIKETH